MPRKPGTPRNKPKNPLSVVPELDPTKCYHIKKDGKQCGNGLGAGTEHKGFGKCQMHGGNSPTHRAAAARQMQAAYTQGLEVDPVEALQQALWLSAGAVAYCQQQIHELEPRATKGFKVTFAQVEAGEITRSEYHAGRMLNTWMLLYNEERDRLSRTAVQAIQAGLQERQVKVLEERAVKLADALRKTFDEIELTEEQRQKAIPALRRYLEMSAA